MGLMLGNPAGLWLLLGLPAVLAIHFLQNRARRIPVSTLFLLDHLPEENRQGAVFQELRRSLLLWLQLLAVLLATWLLVQPLWQRAESVQSVVFVLDSSHSMQAFRPETQAAVDATSRRLDRLAASTEWTLLASDPRRAPVHTGPRREDLLPALDAWRPDSGAHDPQATLLRAREMAGPEGLVIWVTDHLPPDPWPGVHLLAVGRPLDQVGFAGATTTPTSDGGVAWRALLVNHGDSPQTRSLTIDADDQSGTPEEVALAPGEFRTLAGAFPPGVERLLLRLDPDILPIDDQVPLRRPAVRPLHVRYALAEAPREWARRIMATVPGVAEPEPGREADFAWVEVGLTEPLPGTPGVVLLRPPSDAVPTAGEVVAEDHPLTESLSWQGLLCGVWPGFLPEPGDEVLLWQGGHPLIIRRGSGARARLILRFDVTASNAPRLPALVLLLHRFAEQVRAALPGTRRENVELDQTLALTPRPDGGLLELRPAEGQGEGVRRRPGAPLRAPATPGFFQVVQEEVVLFDGAALFADAREADLRRAAARDDTGAASAQAAERHHRADRFTPLWLALLGLTLVGGWAAAGKGGAP
jgi:hypothetical protein